jgi:hypothetical protein
MLPFLCSCPMFDPLFPSNVGLLCSRYHGTQGTALQVRVRVQVARKRQCKSGQVQFTSSSKYGYKSPRQPVVAAVCLCRVAALFFCRSHVFASLSLPCWTVPSNAPTYPRRDARRLLALDPVARPHRRCRHHPDRPDHPRRPLHVLQGSGVPGSLPGSLSRRVLLALRRHSPLQQRHPLWSTGRASVSSSSSPPPPPQSSASRSVSHTGARVAAGSKADAAEGIGRDHLWPVRAAVALRFWHLPAALAPSTTPSSASHTCSCLHRHMPPCPMLCRPDLPLRDPRAFLS